MNKFNASLFVFFYLILTGYIHSATVEINNKKFECVKRHKGHYRCLDGERKFIVVDNVIGYLALSLGESEAAPRVEFVSKLTDENKVIYQGQKLGISPDNKTNRLRQASAVVDSLEDEKDEYAQSLVLAAKAFLEKEKDIGNKLNIELGDNNEKFQCSRGDTRPLTEREKDDEKYYNIKFQCEHFDCKGSDSGEKVLAYIPSQGNSYNAPNVLRMKDGQAAFTYDNFKVVDEAKNPVFAAEKKEIIDPDEGPAASLYEPGIDRDLFIPSKYEASKSSFNTLTSESSSSSTKYCAGEKMASLFSTRDTIAAEMKAYLAEADIVEYLKVIGGNVHSYYVDQKKASKIGCVYDNKILDQSVLGKLDYLKKLANSKPIDKYLSVVEVQELFKKAESMSDIPFGYKYDGCYARAHVMARRFEEMGIPVGKVWIKGDLIVPGTDIRWNYHVAPVIDVKNEKGELVKYVIDPSLNGKAVPVDEWVKSMGNNMKGPVMKTTYPFPQNAVDFQRTTVALSSADPYAPTDMFEQTEDDKMQSAYQTMQEYTLALKEASQAAY